MTPNGSGGFVPALQVVAGTRLRHLSPVAPAVDLVGVMVRFSHDPPMPSGRHGVRVDSNGLDADVETGAGSGWAS